MVEVELEEALANDAAFSSPSDIETDEIPGIEVDDVEGGVSAVVEVDCEFKEVLVNTAALSF